MKDIEIKLPSGKKITIRESTGLDEMVASQRFIGKSEDEKKYEPWELIAKCVTAIDGEKKQLKGYEALLTLTSKDLNVLLVAFTNFNTPTKEELKDLKSFFPDISKT